MLTNEIRKWNSVDELVESMRGGYRETVVDVEGQKNDSRRVFAFTLSTCMWCTLGKKWLNERGLTYSYLDVDKIPVEEKNRLKAELRELTGEQPRFPFLILTGKGAWHSGYDPSAWEAMLRE